MKKMRLELDKLVVESFATSWPVKGVGTVEGQESEDYDYNTKYCDGTETCAGGGDGGGGYTAIGGVGCQNSAFPCQSVNACNTDACHNLSLEFPNVCGVISWPGCSAKCTNMVGCTSPQMGC